MSKIDKARAKSLAISLAWKNSEKEEKSFHRNEVRLDYGRRFTAEKNASKIIDSEASHNYWNDLLLFEQQEYVEQAKELFSSKDNTPTKEFFLVKSGIIESKVISNIDIRLNDCLIGIKAIPDNSISAMITDPPYFIDGMDDKWDNKSLQKKVNNAKVIGSLPVGMKFDPEQGVKFQAFMAELAKETLRVLMPGGFALSFSQARLYHRMAMAFEEQGYEIRDMLGWTYEGQAKAFSQDHFVRKMKKSKEEKDIILDSLCGRKTPQLKPMIEPIVLAVKPKEGTYIDNWMKYGVGLIDTKEKWEGKFPGNIISCKKPSKEERGEFNAHFTVKPLQLMQHLIRLFTKEGDTVLDPFTGSGTTALACKNTNRHFIGFEKEKDYYDICLKRLEKKI